MGVTTLKNPPGIAPSKVVNIPEEWSAAWFQSFIKQYLQPADIRNAIGGTGITISGSGNEYATISATGGGTGTVTSVALADASTTPIYTISGSPITTHGTLDITLATQSANLVFAGPSTGSAAQPTFRSLVAADVPTLNQNTTGTAGGLTGGVADSIILSGGDLQLSGDSATPGNSMLYGTNASGTKGWYAQPSGGGSGANPTAKVGLSAVNGSATTFLRSDGAPPLDVSIAPTWTGAHTFDYSGGIPVTITPAAATYALQIQASSSNFAGISLQGNGASLGSGDFAIFQNTNSDAYIAQKANNPLNFQTNATTYMTLAANGGLTLNSPTGGTEGAGTVNVSGGYYVNGVKLIGGVGGGSKVTIFTQAGGASQSWTKQTGTNYVRAFAIGGGGGGGSGAKETSGTLSGGGGGGQAGGISCSDFMGSDFSGSVTITFSNASTGGAGGAAKTAAGNGNNGTNGSNAQFGTLLIAYGGGAGTGGGPSAGGTGGSGAGLGLTCAGTGGGNGGATSASTGNPFSSTTTSPSLQYYGLTGGGGGGGANSNPAAAAGQPGGTATSSSPLTGAIAGGSAGAANTTGGQGNYYGLTLATGGGGGGATVTASNAGNGGAGATYGTGGGGGGASFGASAGNSGAGGNGGAAAVIVIEW